jgi:hypothetical protein
VRQAPLDQQTRRFQLLVGLIVALFVAGRFNIANIALADPDTLWHIKVGADIWRTFSLPVRDTYSFTFSGHPWIAKEWLAQLFLFASHAAYGWNGVFVLTGLSVGITALLFYREIGRVANPRIAAIVTVIAMFLASIIFTARPHILVLPIAVAWTAWLFRAAESQRPPSLFLLALLVAWTNLHPSVVLGIAIACFAFLHFLETCGFRDRALVQRWAIFLTCCLAASFINPYGFEPFILAVKLSSGNEWVPTIAEWLPFNAQDKPFHEAGLLAFFAILLWVRPKLSLSKIGFLVFALHMYLVHQRFVFVYALLAPLAVIGDLVRQDSRLSLKVWAGQPRDVVERLGSQRFGSVLLAVVALVTPVALFRTGAEPPADVFAEKAIRFARDNLLPGNVLNAYNFGGTLIFHGIPTFIDGRTDQLFLGEFANTLAETVTPNGAGAFTRQLDDYKIGWTLLEKIDTRNLILDKLPQWQRVYSDGGVVIHKRIFEAASDTPDDNAQAKSETR